MIITPTRSALGASLAVSFALLGACSSTPIATPDTTPKPMVAAAPAAAPTPAPTPATAQPTPDSAVRTVQLPDHLNPQSAVSTERSVYFGFDEISLNAQDTAVVERHGKYLAANPALAIRVEGNTDERGSAEYNLALGQRRAEAVVQALKIYGVKGSQLEAVSWGEEKPRAAGSDESTWSQNRRADLQYPAR